jgi:FAD/FMN-containing dehydrogenase
MLRPLAPQKQSRPRLTPGTARPPASRVDENARMALPGTPPTEALTALRARLGAAAVLTGADVPARNGNDWSPRAPQPPLAVVRPLDAAGVSVALRMCREAGLKVVPQGGLTGLCGGARPEAGWVALSLERMVGVEEIDEASATLTVKAGTPLQTVQQAADAAGFFFALDLGARGSCAIGGNLSTNAGGNRVIRYGMARELVLGLEVVLPDGTVITSLNKMLKNNAGYDLKHLFIGSEGTLGIITRIVLRLHPQPRCTMAALCALPDYAGVVRLLGTARSGLGPLLSAFEVMWPDYWQLVTQRMGVRAAVAGGHSHYVLVEAQGTDESVDAPRFQRWLEGLLEQGVLADAAVAQSLADAQGFWALRDACAEFGQALGPHVSYDVGLAVRDMDAYAQRCKAALAARIPGCDSVYYGHIGDGNLHLVAWLPGARVEQQPKDTMDEVIYGLVREFHGSVSAEHGIGTMKKRWLGHARSEPEIALMRTLKAALDPDGLLNPGKVV